MTEYIYIYNIYIQIYTLHALYYCPNTTVMTRYKIILHFMMFSYVSTSESKRRNMFAFAL